MYVKSSQIRRSDSDADTPSVFTHHQIGPKIYAAFAGQEGPGGLGITRLHQDLADAVNIVRASLPSPLVRYG